MPNMGGPKDWSPAEEAKRRALEAQNHAHEELTALFEDLKTRYPEVGLSFGYIGNIETWGDDRYWYFFTQVQGQGTWGPERMKFGGYLTERLPEFSEKAQADLERWIKTVALPKAGKLRGGMMSGPKDWQPAPLSINDTRVKALRARIRKAISEADHAFWAKIVEELPEVKSGDFGPDDTYKWETAAEEAVMTWLFWNYPHEFLLKPILEHHEAGRQL